MENGTHPMAVMKTMEREHDKRLEVKGGLWLHISACRTWVAGIPKMMIEVYSQEAVLSIVKRAQ